MKYDLLHLTPDHADYARYVAQLTAEPVATQWLDDAESGHEAGNSYLMIVVAGQAAAWAGYQIEDHNGQQVLRLRDQYERHGYRREDLDGLWLYPIALAAVHEQVVYGWTGMAYSYVYRVPRALLLDHGWVDDTFDAVLGPPAGKSQRHPGAEVHQWWRMVRWPS